MCGKAQPRIATGDIWL